MHRPARQALGQFEIPDCAKLLAYRSFDILGMYISEFHMPNPITSNVNSDNRTRPGRQPDNANSSNRIKEALGDREAKWLAEASGLSASSISDYMKGRSPRIDAALKIAAALDVDLEWLFGEQVARRRLDQPTAVSPLIDVNDAEWVDVPEYSVFEIDEQGKLPPILTTKMRKDWLYSSLGETSGIWIAAAPSRYEALAIERLTMIFCKDHKPGERLIHGAHYLFSVNGGVIIARFALREDSSDEPTVLPRDIGHDEEQYQPFARIIGQFARPL
ncbi:helix-turn-helix domain-containing protein [Sphingopyxis macrogoltabida]|uniref:helix-turn-helix domain-containing protein n=1 Tax=Sphingopyxis macrogoltabida TaxID=33050 RepID=UPI0009EBABBC